MRTVVVGGHSRNIGKTSVVSGIIGGLSHIPWTAVKVTQYGHGICAVNGRSCHCAVDRHRFAIIEEKNRDGRADTCRFLRAGAHRSLWVRTKQGGLHEVITALKERISSDPYVIIESNSIIRFIKPDIYLVVLDYTVEDFKESAREHLSLADAAIVVRRVESDLSPAPSWKAAALKALAGKPKFFVSPGKFVTPQLLDFVHARIAG